MRDTLNNPSHSKRVHREIPNTNRSVSSIAHFAASETVAFFVELGQSLQLKKRVHTKIHLHTASLQLVMRMPLLQFANFSFDMKVFAVLFVIRSKAKLTGLRAKPERKRKINRNNQNQNYKLLLKQHKQRTSQTSI